MRKNFEINYEDYECSKITANRTELKLTEPIAVVSEPNIQCVVNKRYCTTIAVVA
jgi:hypothetical protein